MNLSTSLPECGMPPDEKHDGAPIDVYIDNNVWHFLFRKGIDLCAELPVERYNLCITREAEFEIEGMPLDLKSFVKDSIAKYHVRTRPYFGFFNERHSPQEQRTGGFGVGHLATEQEAKFMDEQSKRFQRRLKKSGLYNNEADISLGARSFKSVVLSFDDEPSDPLGRSHSAGGKVVFLTDFEQSGLQLGEFIRQRLSRR